MAASVSSGSPIRTIGSPQSLILSEETSSSWSDSNSSLLEQEENDRRGGPSSSPASGFTNPSSYGSMLALLNNNGQQRQENRGLAIQENDHIVNSAYDRGMDIARLAWLDEMDAEVEAAAVMQQNPSSDWRNRPVTSPIHKKTSIDSCPTYLCARCGTTLALQDELISKAFSGRDGKAFLFFSVLNAKIGPKEDRQLLTGLHTVADLSCSTCQRSVGWCYLRAFEASQRYKEGESIQRETIHATLTIHHRKVHSRKGHITQDQ
jgi:hypothetical protein